MDHDIHEAMQYTLYMENEARGKSITCKHRDKYCEAHDLPCDVCTSYKPIRRIRS